MVDGCENACLAVLRWLCGLLYGLIAPATTAGVAARSFLWHIGGRACFGMAPPEPGVDDAFTTALVHAAPTGTVRTVPATCLPWERLLAPDAFPFGGTDRLEPPLLCVRLA